MAGARCSSRTPERCSSPSLCLSGAIAALVAIALLAGGCGDHPRTPTALADGSRARALLVELENAGSPTVLARVVATSANRLVPGSPEASCIAREANGRKPIGLVVRRIGVEGESVTFRERSAVVGCDGTARASEAGGPWCGGSYGRVFGHRLRDPRLDIAGCRTADGKPFAFAWIQPRRDASYVAVGQPGYVEVYPVVRGVPVRIATASGIESDPIGVTFDISEHDVRGRLLRTYRFTARPSG